MKPNSRIPVTLETVPTVPGYSQSEALELCRLIEEFILCNPTATREKIQEAVNILTDTFNAAQEMRYSTRL